MRQYAGFTLLELLIVLSIMVIGYGAIAIHFASGNDTLALNAAARDLASGLRYVRSQAMLTHENAVLALDLKTNTYQLANQEKVYTLADEIDVTVKTAKEDLDDGVAQLRFFPDGSSTGGRIVLARHALSQEITINWLTGHVTLAQ
ncbi:MAG TPA: type II secretion system protein GspH [Methylococcaceae bacterium]|nr:type II secretion system protein GspH [Methylococcaceae bacterium]